MACEDLAREALEPFAKEAEGWSEATPDDFEFRCANFLTVGDLRRARTAYDAIGSGVKADSEEQIARAILPTVWQMFDEYGGRLNPSAEADRKGSLAQARRVLSCLSTHTAAGAGPVGEAVAWQKRLASARGHLLNIEAHAGASGALSHGSAMKIGVSVIRNVLAELEAALYARPVEEPSEVERLTRERDDAFNNGYRHGNSAASAAVANELAETRERLEKLEAAAGPIAAYTRLPGFERLPADHVITQGSRLAARQLTAGDLRRLDAVLTGDAQEAGR